MRRNKPGEAKNRAMRRRPRVWPWAVALILAAAFASESFAQSPANRRLDPAAPAHGAPSAADAPKPTSTRVTVHVEVVNVPVSVINKRGYPVFNLEKSDFKVYEDGVPQVIRYFNRVPAPPLRIGLLVDTSNSAAMTLHFEKEAAIEFSYNMLRNENTANEIFLETFDTSSNLIQDFTSNPELLNNKIHALKAGGGQALYDAIYYACKNKLMNAGPTDYTRRVLVLISNGVDVESRHTLDEAISMAHLAQTSIYTIGNVAYGFNDPGARYLRKLAEETGGEAFFPLQKTPGADYETGYLSHGQFDNLQQNRGLGAQTGIYGAERLLKLADALTDLGRQLNNQYDIGYTPSNPVLNGTYRTIRVNVDRKDVRVLWKPGYFAVHQPTSAGAAKK